MKIDLSSSDWKLITIKYSNKCCVCDGMIPQGSKELWKQGEGVKHQSCVGLNKVEEEKAQTKGKDPMIESKWHDPKIYPYGTVITHCQFCGTDLSRFRDSYINLDRYCCSTCFGTY